ncbi:signal peptidase (plasmid) [Rhodococcus opacus]|uniref:Lipoprotein signal peptidase n=1 Tax=Rhodococcus opacus TaxID=37919 RepID=A0A076EZJ6_RHOOP|nr:signal peptidase [Rhodococcus opacus]
MSLDSQPKRTVHVRRVFVALAGVLALTALIGDPLARRELDGRTIDLGVLQLKLAFNSGVAFSVGGGLPAEFVLAVTAAITAAVGYYAWRTLPESSPIAVVGLAGIFAGALANVIDRSIDGRVTDYFHTGWWPTFNLADTYIVGGVVLFIASLLLAPPDTPAKE